MRNVNPTGKHAKQAHHHGEGSVVERRDKYRIRKWVWQGSYVVDGLRHRPRVSATSEKQAWKLGARKAKEIADRQEAGASLASMDTTVSEYVTTWLDSKADQIRPRSWVSYELDVRLRIIPALGKIPLVALTVDNVRRAARLWGSPARKTLVRLRSALDDAVAEGIIGRNVARLVDAPRAEHRAQPTIGPDELRAIFAAVSGDWLYPIVVLAGACGLRRGEVLGLRRKDIDLKAATLTVAGQIGVMPFSQRLEGDSPYQLTEPMTPAAYRTIGLPPIAVAALTAHLARLDGAPANLDGLIFTAAGGPLNPNRVTRRYGELLKKAGIEGVVLHSLRHGYATLLNAEGVGTRTAMALLGHSTEAMTHRYTSVLPESRDAAAASIERAIGGK